MKSFTYLSNPLAVVLHDCTGEAVNAANPIPVAIDSSIVLNADITLGTIGIVGASGNRLVVNVDGSINTAGGGAASSVTVSNFPATQPVSIASPVAVTGTFYQATQPVSGTFWQATQPVSGTFWQATQPVSGTVAVSNFPATQPVSGTVAVSNFPAPQAVTGAFFPATQPVSGTFWQATQPVSIASMPSTPVTGTFWQTTQPVSGTFWQATQPVSLAALPALVAGAALIGKVGIDQTTPGTTNLVQDTGTTWGNPANRQSWTFSAVGIAGVTTEALLSSVASVASVAAAAATSYTVPAGKTLRITSYHIDVFNTSTVASRGALTVRAVPAAGTLAASSPIVHRLVAQVIGAVSGNAAADDISLPEGFCLPAGSILGVSQLCLATTCTVSFCLTGYLY